MPILVQSDLKGTLSDVDLIQCADDNKDGIADADVITQVLAAVEGLMRSYLEPRYGWPLAAESDRAKGIAKPIAKYLFFDRRQRATASMRQGYEDSLAFLRDLASGKASLGIDPPAAGSPESSQGAVLTNESEWSRDKLTDF